MNEKILIIEDELNIARMLRLELEREGYLCTVAADGEAGLAAALSGEFALALLDVMLPKMDGFAVLKALREKSSMAVVMLTARGEIEDRVEGLELGADDYLTKPFAMRELTARVRTALRHAKLQETHLLTCGKLQLDRLQNKAWFDGEELLLTHKELEILGYFMAHKNETCSREELLREVWGYDYMGDTNLIDVYIRYLRSKIDQRFGVQYLKTVRGLGYVFGDADE